MRQRIFPALLAIGALILTGFSLQKQPKWTTSIKMVQTDRINESPDSIRGRSFGSATWTTGETPTLSVVDLTFTNGGDEKDLTWAIIVGRCRSAGIPVAPLSSFPEIDTSGGGAARVRATLSLELPKSGQYHIDVYKDRAGGEESLIACGDLRYSAKG